MLAPFHSRVLSFFVGFFLEIFHLPGIAAEEIFLWQKSIVSMETGLVKITSAYLSVFILTVTKL